MSKAVKLCSVILSLILLFSCTVINDTFFINVSAATTGYVTGSDVNVRSEASTSSKSLGKLTYVTVEILDSKEVGSYTWYKIKYNDIVGYIRGDYIRINQSVTVTDKKFEELLKEFPESYRDKLRALHEVYPNWNFIPDKLTMSFETAVKNEATGFRKLVNMSSDGISWRSLGQTVYNWSTGTWYTDSGNWTGASKEVVAYYMDPRNFLDANTIYQYMEHTYFPDFHTENGVKEIVKGTFLEKGYTDANDTAYGGDYIKVIMAAAKASNVSPYIIASTIKLEQGVNGTSGLISGNYNSTYKGYYNFFNVNASGKDVIGNGLAYAKAKGWDSRSKAIIEGAKWYAAQYINKGQNTYFYKDFNLVYAPYYQHQYAQSVYDARSSGYGVRTIYNKDYNAELTFRIPVYTSIPSKAAEKPVENNKLNNYYFTSISVSGLSPTFSMYTQEYDLAVSGNTTINVKVPKNASYASATKFNLTKGMNKISLVVKAQTGYTNTYVININSERIATLNITVNGSSSGNTSDSGNTSGGSSGSSAPTYMLGDTNGDARITIIDLANVQKHLLKKITLKGNNLLGADTNKDGKITIVDLANVQKHLLKKITLGG